MDTPMRAAAPGTAAWARVLTTNSGYEIQVRAAGSDDGRIVAALFADGAPGEGAGTRSDHFLAFDPDGVLIGGAALATDRSGLQAQAAVVVRPDYRGRGIGWRLLDFLADFGRARGVRIVNCVESAGHQACFDPDETGAFHASAAATRLDPNLVAARLDS